MSIILCVLQVAHWEFFWTAKENLEGSELKKQRINMIVSQAFQCISPDLINTQR